MYYFLYLPLDVKTRTETTEGEEKFLGVPRPPLGEVRSARKGTVGHPIPEISWFFTHTKHGKNESDWGGRAADSFRKKK